MDPGRAIEQLFIFQGLTAEQRERVLPLFSACEMESGTVIFEQGQASEYLYLLVEGEVVIQFKPEDGPALIVARVRPQGVAGWSAALGSPAYTSGAQCACDCYLLRISSSDLRKLCELFPETGAWMLERLALVIAERLRNTHTHVIAMLEQGLNFRMGVHAS